MRTRLAVELLRWASCKDKGQKFDAWGLRCIRRSGDTDEWCGGTFGSQVILLGCQELSERLHNV